MKHTGTIPQDMEYKGISKLEIIREGDMLILRPARPSWLSLKDIPAIDAEFLTERPDVTETTGIMPIDEI